MSNRLGAGSSTDIHIYEYEYYGLNRMSTAASGGHDKHTLVVPIICTAIYSHIEVETIWPPFPRRHFQMDFFNANICFSTNILLNLLPEI